MALNPDNAAKQMTRRPFVIAGRTTAAAMVFKLRQGIEPVETKSTAPKEVEIVEFSDAGQRQDSVALPLIMMTDAEWKQQLSSAAFEITRRAGTERSYSGQYWNLYGKRLYRCICCDTDLFSSDTIFDFGTGWPSFWRLIAKENIRESFDLSLGMERTVVSCRRCDAHLGHVFDDGPRPMGLCYCMNSVGLRFVKFA